MPSHPLGNGESVRLVAGRRVWDVLTPALAGRSAVSAAVARIGRDADRLLPLGRGATVVVNAGDQAIRQGRTDPAVLLRWHRNGVRVHSLDTLNGTLILLDDATPFVAAGSVSASPEEAQRLDDAVMVADLPDTLAAARLTLAAFVTRAGSALTETQLLDRAAVFGVDRPVAAPAAAPAPLIAAPPVAAPARVASPAPAPAVAQPAAPLPPAPAVPAAAAEPAAPAPKPEVVPGVPYRPGPVPQEAAPYLPSQPSETPSEQWHLEDEPPTFPWPRPHTLGLAQISEQPATLSADAEAEFDRLNLDHGLMPQTGRVPRDGRFSIEVIRVEETSDRSRPFGTSHRIGTHVVAVESSPETRRPRTVNEVHPPGRVVGQFLDDLSYPRCQYYFLLVRQVGPRRVYKDVVLALKSVGETANFDRSYMVPAKIDVLLALWPDAVYD